MKFHVTGADAKTGVDRTIIVTAKDEQEALKSAKAQGIFASAVVPFPEPPSPLPPVGTAASPHPRATSSPWAYKMVQVPPTIVVRSAHGTEAAQYLQHVVDMHVHDGWEFFRVDPITVHIPAGCLASLLGKPAEMLQYHVITFRRPV